MHTYARTPGKNKIKNDNTLFIVQSIKIKHKIETRTEYSFHYKNLKIQSSSYRSCNKKDQVTQE